MRLQPDAKGAGGDDGPSWKRAAFFWAACVLCGAALVRPLTKAVPLFARAADVEAFHIVAHVFLYGTLALLIDRGLRRRPVVAGALGMLVGLAQETVQVVLAGRGLGLPELFDLGVDATAITAALSLRRWVSAAPHTPRILK